MREIKDNSKEKVLAIDIGGTYIKYALVEDCREIVCKSKTPSCGIPDICRQAEKMLDDDVRKIAVSCGGFWKNGKCLGYANICDAQNMQDIMREKLGREVKIENDAICNLLCESEYGALKNCRDAAVLVIGTSVGCAVMLNGKIYKGAHCQAASMFLMPEIIDGNAYVCDSHSNSKKAVSSVGDERCGDFKKLCEFAEKEKEYSIILDKYINAVALKCLYVTLSYDVEKIALGGAIAGNHSIFENINKRLVYFAEIVSEDGQYPHVLPMISVCDHGEDANLIGASLLWRKEEL